jgi:hypothetical protein
MGLGHETLDRILSTYSNLIHNMDHKKIRKMTHDLKKEKIDVNKHIIRSWVSRHLIFILLKTQK